MIKRVLANWALSRGPKGLNSTVRPKTLTCQFLVFSNYFPENLPIPIPICNYFELISLPIPIPTPSSQNSHVVPETTSLQHLTFWTIAFGHRKVKTTSQKLSWNCLLGAVILTGNLSDFRTGISGDLGLWEN